jgi:hypothetical protein
MTSYAAGITIWHSDACSEGGGGAAGTESEEPDPILIPSRLGRPIMRKFAPRSPWLENHSVLTSCKGKVHPRTGHEDPEGE